MDLGQPKDLKDKVMGGGLRRVRVQDGTNIHRVLYGPVKVNTIYYPTLIEDEENSGFKQAIKTLKPAKGQSPFAALASLDKSIRKKQGEENVTKSSLDPATSWLYLVIDRKAENYPTVAVAEYKYTIFNKLIELEKELSVKDPTKLRHGLIFMYDLIIEKFVKAGMSKQFGTRYDVQVDPENVYSGKVPASYLGLTGPDLTKLLDKIGGMQKFFSDKEWEAIEACDFDLEIEGKPDTPEEMLSKIDDYPLFLGATDPNGSYRFPSVAKFKAEVENLGLKFFETDAKDNPKTKSLNPKAGEEDEVFKDTETETVKVEETEVIEEEKKEEKKPEKKKEEEKKPKDDKKEEKVSGDEEFPEW